MTEKSACFNPYPTHPPPLLEKRSRTVPRPWLAPGKPSVRSIPFLPAIPLCAGTHNRVEYIMPCTFRRYVLPTSIERRLAITRANVMRSHTLHLSRSFPLSTAAARCVSYYSTSPLFPSPLSLCTCTRMMAEREREGGRECTRVHVTIN